MEPCENKIRLWRIALSTLSVAIGVTVLFIGLGADYDNKDEFYQALCVRDYRHSPLAMLSFYVGNVWCRLFGETILHLRQLASVAYLVSIGMASVYLYRQSRNPVLSSAMFLLLSIGARIAGMDIYGWDVGAYPYITAVCISVLWYAAKPGAMRICVVGALCALMGLSRIPALSGLTVVLCVIIFRRKSVVPILKDSLAGLASFALVFAVAVFIMVGSIRGYIGAFNADNVITGHSFDAALSRFVILANIQLREWIPFVAAFAIACLVSMLRIKEKQKTAVFVFFVVVQVLCTALYFRRLNLGYLPVGCLQSVLYLLLLYCILHRHQLDKGQPCNLVIILSFSLVATVGSDSIPFRTLAIPMIALAIACMENLWNRTLWQFLILSIACVFAVFSDAQLLNRFHGDEKAVSYSSIPRLDGLYGTQSHLALLADIMEDIGREKHPVLFVGDGKFIFDYVVTDKTGYKLQRYHYNMDRRKEREEIAAVIDGYETVFIVGVPYGFDDDNYPHIEHLLLSEGFEKAKEGKRHKVFRRKEGNKEVVCASPV